MNKIQKAYQYFYYKIYKSIEYTSESQGAFWSEWKASLVLMAIEIFFLSSFTNYYNVLYNTDTGILPNSWWLIIVIFLTFIDFVFFHRKDQWKEIVFEFDKLPKRKNNKGSWLVFGIILFIIINFILSFYLYYQT